MPAKLSLLLLILKTASGSPYNKVTDVSEYDYDGAQGDIQENDADNEIKVWETPVFTTNPQTLLVNEGDTIRLPCFVNRLEGFVMLWKRGESIITVGNQIVDKEVRLEAGDNGNNLVIGPASPQDEQQYTCQISSYKPSEIVHSVKVRVKPIIAVSPSEGLVVREGEPAHLSCSLLAGSPTPQLTWTRRHQPLPDNARTKTGSGTLSFDQTTRHDAGHYVCSADNGFGPDPVTREVKLSVHHAPSVEDMARTLHSGLGREESLECVVHSSPRAQVIWTKDGEPLVTEDSSQEGNIHSLVLSLEQREDFGVYRCTASNELGSSHKEVTVTGLSSPAVYGSPSVSLYPDSYTLSWTAESKTEITSFRVLYRLKTKDAKWSELKISPRQSSIDPQGGGTWEGSALLSQLRSASQYEAKVMPENFFGLSQPEKAFHFGTKGAVPYHQPSTAGASRLGALVTSLVPVCLLWSLI